MCHRKGPGWSTRFVPSVTLMFVWGTGEKEEASHIETPQISWFLDVGWGMLVLIVSSRAISFTSCFPGNQGSGEVAVSSTHSPTLTGSLPSIL